MPVKRTAAERTSTMKTGRSRQDTAPAEPENRAEATREQILEAALEVFCERTYGEARIPEIAERAGVATGTIYNYFPSKRALVNEVFRHWKLKTREYAYPRTQGMSTRNHFHRWFVQFCRFAIDHPLAHEFLQTHHHAPYLDEESLQVANAVDLSAVRFMREGQREGIIKKGDPDLLIAMVVGLFVGLTLELRGRGVALDEKTLALGEACAWDMLRAR